MTTKKTSSEDGSATSVTEESDSSATTPTSSKQQHAIYVPSEVETAMERLLDKFTRWVVLQPEWVLLFNHDRATRRRVADALSKSLTTIPKYENPGLNRKMRHTVASLLKREGMV
jgi:hypothetical protein